MITFSAAMITAMSTQPVDYFHMIKIVNELGAVTKAVTTHWANVLINSVTYLADGSLVRFDPPQITTTVDREQYKFILADPSFNEAAATEASLVGHRVEVRVGVLHATTKQPLTNLSDTLLVYAGRIDGASYNIKTDRIGESLLQITCASPLADLDMKRMLYCSRDFVRGRHPDDSSCDQVYGGSGVLALKWGKP